MKEHTFQKYKFKSFNKKYPELFKKEKIKLKKSLTNNVEIEHVGSTAVPGLGGKGIIDILVYVSKKDFDKNFRILEKNKFQYKKHPGDNKRKFFQKRIVYGGKERRVHIHLTSDKGFRNSFIAFRDYLRKNKKARDEYIKIKKEAASKAKEDKDKYSNYKLSFLKRHIKKALENH